MIEIKGKYNIAKIFTDVVDSVSTEQITGLCDMQAYSDSKIRIMPDVHAGAGCTIGTTMTISKNVCPNLVGNIGKDIPNNFFQSLDKFIRKDIPHGKGVHNEHNPTFEDVFKPKLLQDLENKRLADLDLKRAARSLGSLGGGNHFIEVGKDKDENYWVTVHSGSRNIGNQIALIFQKEAVKICKDDVHKNLSYLTKDDLFDEYIAAMHIMQDYASCNRDIMVSKILSHFDYEIDKNNKIETIHNYIDFSNEKSLILRKGAVSAKLDELLLVPFNMRDGIIIAKGKGNPDWNYSSPHGAGRIYARIKAKQTLNLKEFKTSMQNVYSTCISEHTLDESPMAYKSMDNILIHIGDTVEIIDTIKPVYNFKAS